MFHAFRSGITLLHQIELNRGHITKLRWSRDGRFLALPTQSGLIAIFDIETLQLTSTLGPHSGEVTAVSWNRNAELLLTSSLDRSIGLWELKSGKRAPFTAGGHQEPVHSVEWTDEEAYAMTCSADRVRAFDGCCLLPGWTKEMEDASNAHTGFTAASCSCRSTFLLGMAAENGTLLVLASLLSGAVLDSVRMDQPVRCLAWSPAEELLALPGGEGILVFRATQEGFAAPPRELTMATPGVAALAFSGNGRLLSSRDALGLKIWDVRNGRLIAELHENVEINFERRSPAGIAWHPTRPLLAAVTPNGNAFRILNLSAIS